MVPSNVQQTQHQITNVLNIIHSGLLPVLLNDLGDPENNDPALDGGVKAAAEGSYIKACALLDRLMDEPHRWSSKGPDEVEEALKTLYQKQGELATTQQQVVEQGRRPSRVMRIMLFMLPDGRWVATTGPEPGSLRGFGSSPDEACDNFDLAYYNKTEYPAQPEKPPVEPEPAPEKPRGKRKRKR